MAISGGSCEPSNLDLRYYGEMSKAWKVGGWVFTAVVSVPSLLAWVHVPRQMQEWAPVLGAAQEFLTTSEAVRGVLVFSMIVATTFVLTVLVLWIQEWSRKRKPIPEEPVPWITWRNVERLALRQAAKLCADRDPASMGYKHSDLAWLGVLAEGVRNKKLPVEGGDEEVARLVRGRTADFAYAGLYVRRRDLVRFLSNEGLLEDVSFPFKPLDVAPGQQDTA